MKCYRRRDNSNLFLKEINDRDITSSDLVGPEHRGEKFREMGGDGPSASADIRGPTDENPFALKWDDQRANILRAFLFMRGDDGVEHGAEELAKKTHSELVDLCVQAQRDRKRAIDKPWLMSVKFLVTEEYLKTEGTQRALAEPTSSEPTIQ